MRQCSREGYGVIVLEGHTRRSASVFSMLNVPTTNAEKVAELKAQGRNADYIASYMRGWIAAGERYGKIKPVDTNEFDWLE